MYRFVPSAVVFLAAVSAEGAPAVAWHTIAPGVEYAEVRSSEQVAIGDSKLHVVRVDPARSRLALETAMSNDGKKRTAAAWCRQKKLAVAINAGMFSANQKSNVGYLKRDERSENARFNDYRSLLVFGPKSARSASAAIVDLDEANASDIAGSYANAVQNLRLIKGDRKNVWRAAGNAPKRWSEAAIAIDGAGRLLFVFSRSPYPMETFNRVLLSAPLDIRKAMHGEGGPEASLSIHGGGIDLDFAGSYETGFEEDDANDRQWPIPNVLGVAAE